MPPSDPDRSTGLGDQAPPLHALLVAIQRYPGSELYPDLEGCVRDVQAMERYLSGALGVPIERIETLAAPGETTYEGLTAALHRLEARCRRGDHALFHYSGHGGRTPTAFKHLKGLAGKDECLVPVNIAEPKTPYLRDTEIDAWVQRMVAKEVFVTLVLDCCHSGGMRRIGEPRVRGGRRVDPELRPLGQGLASTEEQRRVLQSARRGARPDGEPGGPGRAFRHAAIQDVTRAASEGYALFAACRPWEKAREYAFDGVRPSGALTHFLLRALERSRPDASYRQLHERVVQGVHGHFRRQTPVFEGEVRALPLGHRALPRLRGIEVLDVQPGAEESEPSHLVLAAGYAQGVGEGARFDLLRLAEARERWDGARPFASAEVVEATVSTSRAILHATAQEPGNDPIRPGDRAMLVHPGRRETPRSVRLPQLADPVEDLVREIGLRLERQASPWLRPVSERSAAEVRADFEVRIAEGSKSLSIHDLAGAPLPHLPALPVEQPSTVDLLWRVLEHLARYEAVRSLRCEESALEGKVDVRFEPDPEETDLEAEALSAYPPEVATDRRIRLVVENRFYLPLHVAVLDLQPDWGVSQIFPGNPGSFQVDAPGSQEIRLQTLLPTGFEEGTDVLAVFAATVPFDTHGLELPSLTGVRETEPRALRSSGSRGPRSTDAWLTVHRELRIVRRLV